MSFNIILAYWELDIMKKSEVADFVSNFEGKLEEEKFVLKNKYDDSERFEIFKMCRKFSRVLIPNKVSNERVKEEVLRPYFLRSLTILNSSIISDYFTDRTQRIKVFRESGCSSDDIELDYTRTDGRNLSMRLIIPKSKLTMDDQIGYAHEIGHIPELETLRKSYLEYEEVLPMFMEFLIHLRKYRDFDEAFNHFLFTRLTMEQDAARDIIKICKVIKGTSPLIEKYYKLLIADCYKFLESLDYTIQLIKISDDDLIAVTEEIENVLNGKSLIRVAKDLDIRTDNCLVLQKEYKRIGRL